MRGWFYDQVLLQLCCIDSNSGQAISYLGIQTYLLKNTFPTALLKCGIFRWFIWHFLHVFIRKTLYFVASDAMQFVLCKCKNLCSEVFYISTFCLLLLCITKEFVDISSEDFVESSKPAFWLTAALCRLQ